MKPDPVPACPSCDHAFDWEQNAMSNLNYCPNCGFSFLDTERYESCDGCGRLFDTNEVDMIPSMDSTYAKMKGGLLYCCAQCKQEMDVV